MTRTFFFFVLLFICRGIVVLREREPRVGRSSCAGGVREQPCVSACRDQRNTWSDGNNRGSSCWVWWELGEASPSTLHHRKLRQNVGVLSHLAVWLLVHAFNSYLRKEVQTMIVSHSGEGLPEWDACPAQQ